MRRAQQQPGFFSQETAFALCAFVALYIVGALVGGAVGAEEPTPGVQSSWSLTSFEAESEPPTAPAGVPSQVSSPERPGLTPLALSSPSLESRVGWVLESQLPGPGLSVSKSGYPELWSARGPPQSPAR